MHKGEALFPRIDVKKEIEYLEAEDAKQKAAAEAAAAEKKVKKNRDKQAAQAEAEKKAEQNDVHEE